MLRGYVPDGQGTGGYSVSGGVALSTLVTGLVAYWSLDETSGTRADSVGSADLTDNNTVGADTGINNTAASFTAGNLESLTNTGVGASVTGSDGLTIAAWVKGNIPNDTVSMSLGLSVSSGGTGLLSWYHTSALALKALASDDTAQIISAAAATTPNDAFYLVISWYEPSDKKMYLSVNNDTPIATAAMTNHPVFTTGGNELFSLGQLYGSALAITGLIDEAGLWSRVLTEDERAELYNSGTGKFFNGTNFV